MVSPAAATVLDGLCNSRLNPIVDFRNFDDPNQVGRAVRNTFSTLAIGEIAAALYAVNSCPHGYGVDQRPDLPALSPELESLVHPLPTDPQAVRIPSIGEYGLLTMRDGCLLVNVDGEERLVVLPWEQRLTLAR